MSICAALIFSPFNDNVNRNLHTKSEVEITKIKRDMSEGVFVSKAVFA